MARITVTEAVSVDVRIDGVTVSEAFTPGDTEVAPAIAELLIAQGFATPAVKGGKKTEPTPKETSEA